MNPRPKPKTIQLKGKAYQKFRRQVWEDHHGTCQVCGRSVPLLDGDGQFNIFTCAHVAHIKSKGAGGGDTHDNVVIKCPECHLIKEHGPKWSGSGSGI